MSDDSEEPKDISTRTILSNQPKIDELEFFIEGIGRMLFGPEAEDYRELRNFVPMTSHLSMILDRSNPEETKKDVAEDFQFIYSDLERYLEGSADEEYELDADVSVFSFDRYRALLDDPSEVFAKIELSAKQRMLEFRAAEPQKLRGAMAAVNAYAWFELLGLPDLSVEFAKPDEKRATLDPDGTRTIRGLATIGKLRDLEEPAVGVYLAKCHYVLHLDYRKQLNDLLTA